MDVFRMAPIGTVSPFGVCLSARSIVHDFFTPTAARTERRDQAGFVFPCRCCTIRRMAFDPANPPIWLRKLHVTAAQCTPDEYPASPEEGILLCCRLSDEHLALAKAFAAALYPHPLEAESGKP